MEEKIDQKVRHYFLTPAIFAKDNFANLLTKNFLYSVSAYERGNLVSFMASPPIVSHFG